MAVTFKKRAFAGSGENEFEAIIYASGKVLATVRVKKDLLDAAVAQDQTDFGQTTMTDLVDGAYLTLTTLS